MYTFDPSRTDLAREFKANPFGEHSPDLQYLLNLMRIPGDRPFYMLVVAEPYKRWTLAVKEPGNAPPQLTNTVFTDLETAEWEVFKLRWKALGGGELKVE
tara:strand:- start:47 stop:346 length:300 start_codon:yes stop_codon:yes gene_type:complete